MIITVILIRNSRLETALRTIGIGIAMIIRSVRISVTVKTVSMSRVLEHLVKKIRIGAQLRLQLVPHWKTVAKKKAKVHAMTILIMIQLAMLNLRTWPKIRRHKDKMDSLISPKAIFSVV